MTDKFDNLIQSFIQLVPDELKLSITQEEIESLISSFKPKQFSKNELIIQQGKICDFVYFVNKGIVRFFYYKDDGTEITECFHFPNSFMSAYSSFLSGEPTFENAETLEETELLVIHRSDLISLYNKYPNFEKLVRVITEKMYIELEKRIMSIHCQSAEERYLNLLKSDNPEILKKIPLKYIASYLGVSPETLSRIRKKIALN